jgi:glycosyltransferase involved in cell wall biosynthesis
VIVPAFNEQATVGSVVSELRSFGYQVLVVDDGSRDATAMKAREAGAEVLRLPMNQGVGGALRAGFKFAVRHGYDSVVQCDADGQHLPQEVAALLTVVDRQPSDMVIGTRFGTAGQGYSVAQHRRGAMRLLARLASRATRTPITDATSGFRLIRQPLLGAFARDFPCHYLGDTFEALVAAGKAGYSVREIPVQMAQRQVGQSSASFGSALRLTIRAAILVAGNSSYRLPYKKLEITAYDTQTI